MSCAVVAAAAAPSANAQTITIVSPLRPPIGQPAKFGHSTTSVPDVDGDGRTDFAVGDPDGSFFPAGIQGGTHLYSGATGVYLRSFYRFAAPYNQSWSIRGIPDLDGDGAGEVLVSSHTECPPGQTCPPIGAPPGMAHVFSGATGQFIHNLAPPVEEARNFGISVGVLPDADGDGLADLVVGAPGSSGTPRAFIISGVTGEFLHTLSSPSTEIGGRFGWSVAGVPDADGDGYGDVVIGADAEDPLGGEIDGRAYLFSGATGALLHTFEPSPPVNQHFGYRVAGLDDVDGDGRGDVLIGAYLASPDGRAYVFSGGTGQLVRQVNHPNPAPGRYFGMAVAAAPDLDGDGRPELLVGDPLERATADLLSGGVVYVISGATGQVLRRVISPNAQRDGLFGKSVDASAAPPGSGRRADLLIGASNEALGGSGPRWGLAYSIAACRADADADGLINSQDISRYLAGWVQTVGLPPGTPGPPGVHHGDLDGDGAVTSADISAFLQLWLDTVGAGGC